MLVSAMVLSVLATVGATGVAESCPDKILPGTGIGGGGTVTSLQNVTSQAACCALCHGDFHDECSGWVYGPSGNHNCAIMATNGPPKPIEGHVTGINADAPPPPPPPVVGNPCNADIDCSPLAAENWRCKQHTAPEATDNNCHIPGPGTKGNNTCACTIQRCSNTSATPRNASAAVQYLVIGDSISMGMNSDLTALVAQDGWALTHNPGNAASSNLGAHCVDYWVQARSRKWDVISFQFGLHDLGFDTERISVEQYAALLTNITAKLVAVQAQQQTKLLWVKTTPVPTVSTYGPGCNDTSKCLNPPRFDSDVVLYNKAADAVMAAAVAKGARITTADLYSFVSKRCGGTGYAHCDGFQLPMNVHYTAAGWTALAGEMHRILMQL